jgi:hypothetical protein
MGLQPSPAAALLRSRHARAIDRAAIWRENPHSVQKLHKFRTNEAFDWEAEVDHKYVLMERASLITTRTAVQAVPVDRPCLPAALIAQVAELWKGEIYAAAPELAAPAARMLARIMPPSWALEWSLPYWLGGALGLSRDEWLPLTLGNVAGLAYVRLQDDAFDAEIEGETSEARALAVAAHDLWLRTLLRAFGDRPVLWNPYERWMADWAVATLFEPGADGACPPLQRLADRGAPLKVCVAGACLLAGRLDRLAPIASALDALLAGAVLFDHVSDWEADVAAGRFNAFHAYARGRAAAKVEAASTTKTAVSPGAADRRREVLRELMVGDAGRPYFRIIEYQLSLAERRAAAAHVPELAQFALWLKQTAASHGESLARSAQAQLRDVVTPFLEQAGLSVGYAS